MNLAAAYPVNRLFGAWIEAALDIVFPPTCLACRASVEAQGALCGGCWAAMRFIERPFCERLGTPFELETGAGAVSPEAVERPPAFGRARAVVLFEDGPARRLVHRLKYSDRMELAKPMGAWMARAGQEVLDGADVLAPVPLHVTRLWRRQYNQAALLAREVGRRCGLPVDLDLIARARRTKAQVGLSRTERAANLAGAFRVRPGSAEGRRIVLIDDVLTSGATANAAARALLAAGAASVDVLVFARVAK